MPELAGTARYRPGIRQSYAGDCCWSLSVVDVAIVLGPGNPPTLAVLSWQWLSQGDVEQQAKGALASLLLVLLLLIIALVSYLLWRAATYYPGSKW